MYKMKGTAEKRPEEQTGGGHNRRNSPGEATLKDLVFFFTFKRFFFK